MVIGSINLGRVAMGGLPTGLTINIGELILNVPTVLYLGLRTSSSGGCGRIFRTYSFSCV